MPASFYILEIDAGSNEAIAFQYVSVDANEVEAVIDLTGYQARMQIRLETDSTGYLVYLSTSVGGISVVGNTGTITIQPTVAQTMALAPDNVDVQHVYDLELISPTGDVIPFIYGPVKVRANSTR